MPPALRRGQRSAALPQAMMNHPNTRIDYFSIYTSTAGRGRSAPDRAGNAARLVKRGVFKETGLAGNGTARSLKK